MQRGGCIGCYYKSIKEYQAMALLNSQEFKVVEDLENEIQDVRKEKFTIKQGTSMESIRKSVENLMFSAEDMYPVINDASKCGVFCNR
jgi:hypothetical protein